MKFRTFRIILKEYFDENFIFAVRFITNTRLTFFERLWWTAWLVASIAGCFLAVILTHRQWDREPMVIAYGTRFMPISTVPFPAVTICPLIKTRDAQFNLTAAHELLRNGSELPTSSQEMLRTLAHVCPMSSYWTKFEPSRSETVVSALSKIATPMDDSMNLCTWRLKRVPCELLFSETLLDDGICYTFNGIAANELYRTETISRDFLNFTSLVDTSTKWTIEKGYSKDAGLNAYPRRPLSSGTNSGFFALTRFRMRDDLLCNGPYSGFKVTIHPPNELPLTNLWFYHVGASAGLAVVVKPEVFKISPQLQSLSPYRRQCYFNHERYLRYFKTYNQQNCFLECISNYTLLRCGCVKFSMPRSPTTRVCDASKIGCYRSVYNSLIDLAVLSVKSGKTRLGCRCYPACSSIIYHTESFQARFQFSKLLAKVNSHRNITYDEEFASAAIQISFKERHYLPFWRRELMGVNDALAKLAGLFVLILGASALGLAEIVYYCAVRPLRRERQGHQITVVKPWTEQIKN